MTLRIRLLEVSGGTDGLAYSAGSNALDLAGAAEATLRFAIETDDPEELEALRHARRAMLREEWTRGRDGEEPSLEEAVFSPAEISWRTRNGQRRWCLQKVEELTARANRYLAQLQQTEKAGV
jgi:hypothetical protein